MEAVKPVPMLGSSKGNGILTIAVSSRSLFQMEDENSLFDQKGQLAFDVFMLTNVDTVLRPGVAFPVVKRLLALNTPGKTDRVTVVVLSRNSPAAGARVLKSIKSHGLDIRRAIFTSGADRFRYAVVLGADLFLSANEADVRSAGSAGLAAAVMSPSWMGDDDGDDTVRIAFDGDSTAWDAESDTVFRQYGIESFHEHEQRLAAVPMGGGPMKRVIEKLAAMRTSLGDRGAMIRLCLITARSISVHERAMRTLLSWGVHVDEAVFADGYEKGGLAKAFGAQLFFDDSVDHVASAVKHMVPSGQVLSVAA